MKRIVNHIYVQRVIKFFFGTPTDEDLAVQRQQIANVEAELADLEEKLEDELAKIAEGDVEIAKLSKEKADLLGEPHLKEVITPERALGLPEGARFVTPEWIHGAGKSEAIPNPTNVILLDEVLAGKSDTMRKLAAQAGLPVENIVVTTCPYGDLTQHLNDTANCELGLECVYSGVPWPPEEEYS